ncbi:23S rRNA (pseudouridine(1915)-N(3))-methyltransferase RlmH [Mycoplasmopsis columbinasalis]|uniref:Ribosomal RNA large subunit methyltransferase H n=1 Tax=Mycoplasmopsis columbinasalis TaxID=114880 RepID=A0A449BAW5_9BACT|nr:23S rRNA (pseudouridine(1915)-N(3))-methyltransferase RlmH [Mycoplasmopsis columbinasalis]VEU78331.1 ribosomal RNA large subunit methyltransferase h [Mycoplasmopsis columbinasalis]
MRQIRLIYVGSYTPEFKKLFDEYIRKIGIFANVTTYEVKEFAQFKNIEEKKQRETKEILTTLNKIEGDNKVILLSLNGKEQSSTEFAHLIEQNTNLTFIIGGSDGVVEENFKTCTRLAFSKMTFPHQLFGVMLTEQIYRGFMIINNRKYHK